MDVDRFVAIEAVKEEPEWSRNVLDSGHSPTSSFHADVQNSPRVYVTLPPPSSLDKLSFHQSPHSDRDEADSRRVMQEFFTDVFR